MKKSVLSGIFLALLIVFSVTFVSAQSTDKVKKAFACLDDRVSENPSLSLEEAIFSSLARVPDVKVNSTIFAAKHPNEWCWPSSGCTIKDTAQVALVYKQRNYQNTTQIIDWLLAHTKAMEGLRWYLQIITPLDQNAACNILYDGAEHFVQIDGTTQKLSGNPGACLTISTSGYRLQIQNSCVEKEFVISCDKGFDTNLLYEQSTGGTTYVIPDTHSAAANGVTVEQINARCFTTGQTCDYEGTLWAAAALHATNVPTANFTPYLRAMASSNEKYFPSAFLLYVIEGARDSQFARVLQLQRPGGYWEMVGSPYNKWYDTALGMLALGGADQPETSGTAVYLKQLQTENGCWNNDNIRDTAFILYASNWPRPPPIIPPINNTNQTGNQTDGNQTDGGDGGQVDPPGVDNTNVSCSNVNGTCQTSCYSNQTATLNSCSVSGEICCRPKPAQNTSKPPSVSGSDCESEEYFCTSSRIKCLEANGLIKSGDKYACNLHTDICCTVEVTETVQQCSSLGGVICSADQICKDGTVQNAADGQCCFGYCLPKDTPENECGDSGGRCRLVCGDSESEIGKSCGESDDVCCVSSGSGGDNEEAGSKWWLIALLIILIGLVVAGILYRDKLRLWLFKMKGKGKSEPFSRPGAPPAASFGPRPPPRFGPSPFAPRVQPRPSPSMPPAQKPTSRPLPPPARPTPPAKDKEMEETLKKLKEMSE